MQTKRTGAFAACIFLNVNGVALDFSEEEFEALVMDVAEGKANKQQIAKFFQSSRKVRI